MVPPNEFIGLIPTWVAVYFLSLSIFFMAGIIVYRRVFRLILIGRRMDRFDRPVVRLFGALPDTLGQKKVLKRVSLRTDLSGIAHFLIFWGFLSYLVSYILFIYADSIWDGFSLWLLGGLGLRIFVFYLDLLAVTLLLVLVWAAVRRWLLKPSRLVFDLTQKKEAAIILVLIGLLMVLTLMTEAFYIVGGGAGPHSDAPIGHMIAELMGRYDITKEVALILHATFWWLHLGLILLFSLYIPISKHMHIIASPLSFYFRSFESSGTLDTPEDLMEMESFGAASVKDFTWKELLDGYSCAVCGRCTDVCPANISGKILSPMHIVQNMKGYLIENGPVILNNVEGQSSVPPITEEFIQEEALWDCLTCGACVEACPVGVEHINSIVDMRRNLVMEQASMPDTAMTALTNLEQRGHPWKGTTYTRTDWTEGMDIKLLSDFPDTEILLWVGCTAALEKRSQNIARSMAAVLQRAEIDFAILGHEETCTGDPAKRMGNEYLFQTLASRNIEVLERYGVKRILTMCPHCFNTIKNEYPYLGGNYEVLHYSQFVNELIDQKKIKFVASLDTSLTYHDSCYLGRHNGVFDEPREVANQIPGVELIEMSRCRENGFCCGAGGGQMWMDNKRGEKVNHLRTSQFLETNATTVAVSCPFCLQMFEEGIEAKGLKEKKKAVDLIELLNESMKVVQ